MKRLVRDLKPFLETHRAKLPYVIGVLGLLVVYLVSHSREQVTRIYQSEGRAEFKDARVLGSQGEVFYENKERFLSKAVKDLLDAQAAAKDASAKLEARIADLEKGKAPSPADAEPAKGDAENGSQARKAEDFKMGPPPESLSARKPEGRPETSGLYSGALAAPRGSTGSIISFPVKEVSAEKTSNVVIPPGSYVKAKLMTGIEAPEGKTYPVLLQLDYAYIVPNKKKLDLSGCFMIAKSQGDLSTERVQMQASKLSCVSRDGKMFERDVSGFVADDKDNSFAVMGSVSSKQDRVAAMAFLSSVVEGVGKALQQAQTTQGVNPFGGTSSVVSGSQLTYMGAGGAANAASQVTQWYLHQAQNLLPTINIGSGQDVWVVMQETVRLPNDYFRKNPKGGSDEGVYTYFSRIVD